MTFLGVFLRAVAIVGIVVLVGINFFSFSSFFIIIFIIVIFIFIVIVVLQDPAVGGRAAFELVEGRFGGKEGQGAGDRPLPAAALHVQTKQGRDGRRTATTAIIQQATHVDDGRWQAPPLGARKEKE
jgi:hypothetical protein